MGKKRKAVDDLDAERTLHNSFVSAANSISQLFTQAVQQQKKAHTAGARQALERQLDWVLSEYGNSPNVPTQVLLQVLQSELLNVDQLDAQCAASWTSQASCLPGTEGEMPLGDGSDTMADHLPGSRRYQSPAKPATTPFCSWR